MKKMNLIAALFLMLMTVSLMPKASDKTPAKAPFPMPENVKAIVDKSCFGCHNTDSRNDDAKEKLDFKAWDELSLVKKIGTLNHIGEVVEEDKMPPKKFLERYPDRKLSEEETKILTDWVKKEAAALINQ